MDAWLHSETERKGFQSLVCSLTDQPIGDHVIFDIKNEEEEPMIFFTLYLTSRMKNDHIIFEIKNFGDLVIFDIRYGQ